MKTQPNKTKQKTSIKQQRNKETFTFYLIWVLHVPNCSHSFLSCYHRVPYRKDALCTMLWRQSVRSPLAFLLRIYKLNLSASKYVKMSANICVLSPSEIKCWIRWICLEQIWTLCTLLPPWAYWEGDLQGDKTENSQYWNKIWWDIKSKLLIGNIIKMFSFSHALPSQIC